MMSLRSGFDAIALVVMWAFTTILSFTSGLCVCYALTELNLMVAIISIFTIAGTLIGFAVMCIYILYGENLHDFLD